MGICHFNISKKRTMIAGMGDGFVGLFFDFCIVIATTTHRWRKPSGGSPADRVANHGRFLA
jgi:hypothetical protein